MVYSFDAESAGGGSVAGGGDDDGELDIMKSVAARVKAARELAKQIASKEEDELEEQVALEAATEAKAVADGNGNSPSAVVDGGSAPPASTFPPTAPPSPLGDEALSPPPPDYIAQSGGDLNAAAAAAAAAAEAAAAEAEEAERQMSSFAAQTVTDMDAAVTRIRQEAAKRVAAAERERDRVQELSRGSLADALARAKALEETLRQVKSDADDRVLAAEEARAKHQEAAELAQSELVKAREEAAEQVRVAQAEAVELRAGVDAASAQAAAAMEEAVQKAREEGESARRAAEEDFNRRLAEVEAALRAEIAEAEERVASAELDLQAVEAETEALVREAKTEAEEAIQEKLAAAEDAKNAAEELARIEVESAEEAAKQVVKQMEEQVAKDKLKLRKELEEKTKEAVAEAEAKAAQEMEEARVQFEAELEAARNEAAEAQRMSESIAAAKDAVAAAVESAEGDVKAARTSASEAKKEAEAIKAAAAAEIASLSENFKTKIAQIKKDADDKAKEEIANANARAEEAEKKIEEASAAAQAKADEKVAEAERGVEEAIASVRKQAEEDLEEAKKVAEEAVAAAKAAADEQIEIAIAGMEAAKAEAAEAVEAAKKAAQWETEAIKSELEKSSVESREMEIAAAKIEAETALAEAEVKLSEAEIALAEANQAAEDARAQAAAEADELRGELAEARAEADLAAKELEAVKAAAEASEAQSTLAAETAKVTYEAEAEEAKQAAARELAELQEKLEAALADAEEARENAARQRADLESGNELEIQIEIEKRVAEANADAEKEMHRERERAEMAESSLAMANDRIAALKAELSAANAEMQLLDSDNSPAKLGYEAKLKEKDAELEALKAELSALKAGGVAAPVVTSPPPATPAPPPPSVTGPPPMAPLPDASPPAAEPVPAAAPEVDNTEEELAAMLAEVESLKRVTEPEDGTPEAYAKESGQAMTQEQAYQHAYELFKSTRLRQRRLEAEQYVACNTSTVATSVEDVYYWIGGSARVGDSGIVYNRRNKPNGLGDGGSCIMHLGINGWQGDARQIGMQPLAHDHPARTEFWLDSKGGDWWLADPIYIPPEAQVVDFCFSDGGKYDNGGGKDYHSPVAAEDGSLQDYDPVRDRMIVLEQQYGAYDEEAAVRAGRRAQRAFLARQGFTPKIPPDLATAKVVTLPHNPRAGQEIDVYYRYDPSDPDSPFFGSGAIYLQGSFNRWKHPTHFGPLQMHPAPVPPGGEGAMPALTTKVWIPEDAHVMDFVFTDAGQAGAGRYDSQYGLDYHVQIGGALGGPPTLRIVHVAVEMAPIAKVGGMGDVVTALSRAVIDKGHSVEVILPKYDCMDHDQIDGLHRVDEFVHGGQDISVWRGEVEEVPVVFLQPDNGHFDVGCIYGRGDDHIRFGFFSDCALAWLKHSGDQPDVVHGHDWSTSPVVFARRSLLPPKAATVLTIHNLNFGQDLIGRAMEACTFATTVSPTYATEISQHGAIKTHYDKLVGVRNGIDVEMWDPATDVQLTQGYNADSFESGKAAARAQLCDRLGMHHASPETPLVGVVARLTHQKGIELMQHACWRTLERGGQFVLLGSSPDGNVQRDFNNMAIEVGNRFPGNSGFIFAYNEPLSHLVYAACDMLLVPSMFEPCGLTQMIAMRYGTVPVVRKTGGLIDTVFDVDDDVDRAYAAGRQTNGFNFSGDQRHDIDYALDRAMMMYSSDPDRWRDLVGTIMRQDWGWSEPSDDYMEQYWKAAKDMENSPFA